LGKKGEIRPAGAWGVGGKKKKSEDAPGKRGFKDSEPGVGRGPDTLLRCGGGELAVRKKAS